jgi:hypothetical protein
MAKTGLKGSYPLTEEEVDKVVTKVSPGTYALGHTEEKKFIVEYVGRSDANLHSRLRSWIGKYKRFKFGYELSKKAAFEKECSLYHDFGESDKLDNEDHPDRPNDSNWECPVCDIFNE